MTNKPEIPQSASDSARDFSDLRRAVVATFSSSLARTVARVLLIIFVVKLYGVGSFGYLGEVAATVELLAAMACLGLPKTIMAYFDRHKADAEDSANLTANALCLTAVTGVILSMILFLIWPYIFPTNAHVPAYIASAIFIIAITEMMLTLTRSRRVIRWESIVKGLIKPWGFFIFSMMGYFIFIQNYNWQPMVVLIAAYFLSLILSAFFAFLGLLQILKSKQITIGKVNGKEMFALGKESAPIAIVDAGSFAFRRLDIIILGWVTSSDVTGIYYLGQQLATVVEKMRHLFEPMAAPILAQTQSTKTIGDYLRKTCRWIFAATLGSAIGTTIFAQEIMALFDVNFIMAALLMTILLLGEIADGSTGLCELPIIFRNPLYASRNVITALCVEAICASIAVYYLGIFGAAIGFAVGMLILASLRLYTVKKLYDVSIINKTYLKPIIAGAVTAVITFFLKGFLLPFGVIGLITAIIICGAIYLYTLKIMGISMKISDNS